MMQVLKMLMLENKFTLKESKKFKGRYQQIITPGKYLIEVKKPGYEIFLKEYDFTPGEKKVNIELVKEKSYKLKVTVLNYESFSVLDSVHLKVEHSFNRSFSYRIMITYPKDLLTLQEFMYSKLPRRMNI